MGKKTKVGKYRKDKFYQLAKESGYRSRAAFKLLQLNREYGFLEKSRICIDLCAAPGGWLQVAAAHMPLSSIIIGVDLASIRPIGNVITHQEDITSSKCRQLIKTDLRDNLADVILHDGAPNVGKNWLHDAYQQNMLVLQAFKLASEFLRKGGWFITKIFRSKDYYSLLWVFQQFFKRVNSTKPQASRNESAEIFIVCQNYIKPDQIDQKFFDISYVFNDVQSENGDNSQSKAKILNAFKNPAKRHRDGYADNDYTLYHCVNATEFITSSNYMQLLAQANEISLNDDFIANHELTTNEIKQCCKDIRVLGINEIKYLLKWRTTMKELYEKQIQSSDGKAKNKSEVNGDDLKDADDDTDNENKSDDEDGKLIEEQIKNNLESEKKIEKKKRKKLMKEKRKIRDKLALKMEFPGDSYDFHLQNDKSLFSLEKIKTKKQLLELQDALPGLELLDHENTDSDSDIENGLSNKRKVKFQFDKDNKDDLDDFYENIENPNEDNQNDDIDDRLNDLKEDNDTEAKNLIEKFNSARDHDDDDDDNDEENPLITDLVTKNRKEKRKIQAESWFNKTAFDFLDGEKDTENDLAQIINDSPVNQIKNVRKSDDEDDDNDDDDELESEIIAKSKSKKFKTKNIDEENNKIEIVPQKVDLSPYELALGEMMVNSKKNRSLLIDESYNRYTSFGDDENLPKWFADDDKIHNRKHIGVSKEVLERYKKKSEAINVRPIKKVVEAQARKKRRLMKKLDKARKKAESINDNVDMSDKERAREIKQVYKRAGLLKNKKVDVKYVVAKKNVSGKRPSGIKGPYKIVDRRLKKDRRNNIGNKKNKKRKNFSK